MQVLMRGKRIGVEKVKKSASSKSFLAMPEDENAVGFIRYLGRDLVNTDLRVGMKVIYGEKRHQVKIHGTDIIVMDEDNVYATVEEPSVEDQAPPAA